MVRSTGPRELQVLGLLHRRGDASIRDIAHHLQATGDEVTYSTVSTVLARLFEKDLVERRQEPFKGTFRYVYRYDEARHGVLRNLAEQAGAISGEVSATAAPPQAASALQPTRLTNGHSTPTAPAPPEAGFFPRTARPRVPLRIAKPVHTPLDMARYHVPKGLISILPERCKECGFCWSHCPLEVLDKSTETNSKGYHYPVIKNGKEESCVNCTMCRDICPDFAIYSTEVTQNA